MSRLADVLAKVELALGERAEPVTLIAVSKTQPVEALEKLYKEGQRDFGENYVQELMEKARWFNEKGYFDVRWHFIGHLQSNKVKQIVSLVHCIHSVDSEKLALEIAKRREGEALPIFIQVNIDQEATKSGVSPQDLTALVERVSQLPTLKVLGLMCIPEPSSKNAFGRLRELEASCKPHTLGMLSMGMSQDFEEAIRQGSTHVRVGTLLFGPRV